MSALRGALERLQVEQARAAVTRSQAATYARTTFVDRGVVREAAPLVAQVCEPPAAPVPVLEPRVGTMGVPPAGDPELNESAQRLATMIPAPGLVAFVGCGLTVDGHGLVRNLAGAVGNVVSQTVEVLEPSRWDDAAQFAAARGSVFRRGALALAYLSAEKATSRSAELGQTGGVILLVEAGKCDARAADVVATALRLQGVAVRGVMLVE
ncbi:MAG: hypothetical protein C0483_07200 [Pirellula sp.]|nr:hypothetical protein [Pirellula sp.]